MDRDRVFLDAQFSEQIFPVLTPLAIDPAHPFPFIPNLGFTIALSLTNRRDNKDFSALIPVPPQLKRFIRLPDTDRKACASFRSSMSSRFISTSCFPATTCRAGACSASCATAMSRWRKKPKIWCCCSSRCSSAAAAAASSI